MQVKGKIEFQAEIDELEQMLKEAPDYPYRAQVLADIDHNKNLLEIIRRSDPRLRRGSGSTRALALFSKIVRRSSRKQDVAIDVDRGPSDVSGAVAPREGT